MTGIPVIQIPQVTSDLHVRRAEWLKKAKQLLAVPDEMVKSLTEYTRDPATVYRYRNSLAKTIETAGVEPASPRPVLQLLQSVNDCLRPGRIGPSWSWC